MVEVPLLHQSPGERGYLLRPFLVARPMNFHFVALVDRGGLRHDMSATLRAAPPLVAMKLGQFNGYRRNSFARKVLAEPCCQPLNSKARGRHKPGGIRHDERQRNKAQ